MAGRHKGNTKEFRELNFAEQAKSITATINNLLAAIEHHVGHSPRRLETIGKCLAQVDRSGSDCGIHTINRVPRPVLGKRLPAWRRCPDSM